MSARMLRCAPLVAVLACTPPPIPAPPVPPPSPLEATQAPSAIAPPTPAAPAMPAECLPLGYGDSDADGVRDRFDPCTLVAGEREPTAHQCPGCPVPPPGQVQIRPCFHHPIAPRIRFETGTATFTAESTAGLTEVLCGLYASPRMFVRVVGHTRKLDDASAARALGEERARVALAWLTSHGIAAERMIAASAGFDQPIDDNATEEGRRHNDRVEVTIPEPPAP